MSDDPEAVEEFGMTGQIGVAGPAVSDTDLWSVPREALTGILRQKTWYFNDPNNSLEDKAFVEAYRKANDGRQPIVYGPAGS
jgi:branched-chain amino acid transport system substrate-binding protein